TNNHVFPASVKAIFIFHAEDGIRDRNVTGVQTCALPIFLSDDNGLYPINIACRFSVHSQNRIRENLQHKLLIRYRIAYFPQNLDYIFHQFHRQKFYPRSLSIFFWVLNDHSEYLYSHRESKCLLMQGSLIPYRNTLQFFYLQYNV